MTRFREFVYILAKTENFDISRVRESLTIRFEYLALPSSDLSLQNISTIRKFRSENVTEKLYKKMLLDIVNEFLVNLIFDLAYVTSFLWLLWTHFNEAFVQIPNLVAVVNALSFILMVLDKIVSMMFDRDSNNYRVPEKYFNILFFGIGGYPGIYLGMTLFNHKTSKWNFYVRSKFKYAILTIVIWITEYYLLIKIKGWR